MSALQLKRIAIALVIVLFLWGLAGIFGGGSDEIEGADFTTGVVPEEVDTVVFEMNEDTVQLAGSATGEWRVNTYDASTEMVTEFLGALVDVERTELIAQNPASHGRMGVDRDSGIRVKVIDGNRTVADVIFGKSGRKFRTIYVRKADDDRVYLMEGLVAALVRRSVTDWRDKRIFDIPHDSVGRIAIERGGQRYELERGDSGWTFADGTLADSTAVNRVLSGLRNVGAQGVSFASPEQLDSIDFDRPDRRLAVWNRTGDTLGALTFDSAASGFWVQHASGGTVYHLFSWKADDITPVDSTLRVEGEEQ